MPEVLVCMRISLWHGMGGTNRTSLHVCALSKHLGMHAAYRSRCSGSTRRVHHYHHHHHHYRERVLYFPLEMMVRSRHLPGARHAMCAHRNDYGAGTDAAWRQNKRTNTLPAAVETSVWRTSRYVHPPQGLWHAGRRVHDSTARSCAVPTRQ